MSTKKSFFILVFSLLALASLYFFPSIFVVKASVPSPSSTPPDNDDFDTSLEQIVNKIKTGDYVGLGDMGLVDGPGADTTDLVDLKAVVDGLELDGNTTVDTDTVCDNETFISKDFFGNLFSNTGTLAPAADDIVDGVIICDVEGTATTGFTYGDEDKAFVLVTATGAGTALKDLFNGTGQGFNGGDQEGGGVDDFNNADPPASGRYAKGWTQCNGDAYDAESNPGGNWCNTGDDGADAKDDSTGLIWSMPCNGSGCSTFSDASPITYTWNSSVGNNNSLTASQLCFDHGWFLPHQKQLMQAYIDGSYGNLEAVSVIRTYWSASTVSDDPGFAWNTLLSYGGTKNNMKSINNFVRCVRSAP